MQIFCSLDHNHYYYVPPPPPSMAYSVNNNNDQEQNLKHFCKICKKGFGCGRALGGHMRAHGIGDESGMMDDDEDEDRASEYWDDGRTGTPASPPPPANKRMYALRTNPNRLKTCRSCENCGKEFSSWKSFLEHGKCGGESDDAVSSPESESEERRGMGWSRRKSSLRANFENFSNPNPNPNPNPNCPSSEEEDLAHCLMMLSNANPGFSYQPEPDHESCASANRDDHLNNLMRASRISVGLKAKSVAAKGLFECKACKKVFNSHQALGGHRASHKKVKGCYAARLDIDTRLPHPDILNHYDDDEEQLSVPMSKPISYPLQSGAATAPHFASPASSSKRKSKVHECSICHRVFSSGQALGGHKRCHWITTNNGAQETTTLSSSKFAHFDHSFGSKLAVAAGPIDLNLPASNDQQQTVTRNALSFELSAENYFLQSNELEGNDDVMMMTKSNNKKNNHHDECNNNVEEDDANSKLKLAKLSELKDMNVGGEGSTSSWLQVGLASTTPDDNVVAVEDGNTG